MTSRANHAYRENVIGRSLLDAETDNVVAEGFSLQMETGDPDFDARRRTGWSRARTATAGSCCTRGGLPKLQYIPGDLIRNPYKGFDFRTMFDGVECDPAGGRCRFWVRDVDEAGKDTVNPVDARDFVYLAHLDDPLAVRGGRRSTADLRRCSTSSTPTDSVTKAAIMACIFGLIEKRRNPAKVMERAGDDANSDRVQQKAITSTRGDAQGDRHRGERLPGPGEAADAADAGVHPGAAADHLPRVRHAAGDRLRT
jgi:hypothetical protein